MNIKINNCAAIPKSERPGLNILEDFVTYESVDRYVRAIFKSYKDDIASSVSFLPLSLWVSTKDETMCLISDGTIRPTAKDDIVKIKRLPWDKRSLVNDTIYIEIDLAEQEIQLFLDGNPDE